MTGGMEDLERAAAREGSTPAREPSVPQDSVPVETTELPDLS